jgi:DNA-binding response OmpR family regulator
MSLSGEKPRILLVEDDLTLSSLYTMRMEAEGFEVNQCSDGEKALQAAIDFAPDLVLLDIMMPKLNGFDVLDILRNTPETKDTKIVVMSAMGQAADIARAKELGADDYLVKSQVVIADVMSRLRDLLDLPTATPTDATDPS